MSRRSKLVEVPTEVLERASEPVLEHIREDRTGLDSRLRKLLDYLAENLFADELSVERWLAACGIRGKTVAMRFRERLAQPLAIYLEEKRMEVVLRLLQAAPELTNERIAEAVGYYEDTLRRIFRRRFGCTPSYVRRDVAAGGRLARLDPATLRFRFWQRVNDGELEPHELDEAIGDFVEMGARRWQPQPPPPGEDRENFEVRFFREVLAEKVLDLSETELERLGKSATYELRTLAFFEALLRQGREGRGEDRCEDVEIAELALYSLEVARERLSPEIYLAQKARALAGIDDARR